MITDVLAAEYHKMHLADLRRRSVDERIGRQALRLKRIQKRRERLRIREAKISYITDFRKPPCCDGTYPSLAS
jgi:hypothetical protein